MVLSDVEIEALVYSQNLISPFTGYKTGNPSKGLSSFGYDLTLGSTFTRFNTWQLLDTANLSCMYGGTSSEMPYDGIILQPKEFVLAHTEETIQMPVDILAQICDKSTLARCGIDVKNTVIEPGFMGQITLEITNNNNCPVKLYPGKGIAQIIFFKGLPCRSPYGVNSKYQGQMGVTLPR